MEKLQSLLKEADELAPGSSRRMDTLEQIRSMLLDRGSSVRSQKSSLGSGAARRDGQISPDDGQMLEDFYLGNHEQTGSFGLSSIPESTATDRIWDASTAVGGAFAGGHADDDHEHFGDGMDTFMMDDVHEALPVEDDHMIPETLHPTDPKTALAPSTLLEENRSSSPNILLSSATVSAAAAAIHINTNQNFASIAADKGASTTAASAGMLTAAPPIKAPTTPMRASASGRGGGAKSSPNQMSSLAREEQAAIPHISPGDTNGAPVVPLNMEPDKRLSHKEVEQRRREKAKQYFDELRGLLPYGGDSAKFDKNAILHHSILLIRQLMAELEQEDAAASKPPSGQATVPDFRSCFDVSRQPLCFAGLDSRLWDANSAFCTLVGYTRMEISGMSLLNSTAPSDLEAATQHWQQLLKSPQQPTLSYNCKLVRKDAQQIQCTLDLNLVVKGGKPHCLLVSANPCL